MLLKEKEKSAPTDQNGPTALNGLEPVYSHPNRAPMEIAIDVLVHGCGAFTCRDDALALARAYMDLHEAAHTIYWSANWTPDRELYNETEIWDALERELERARALASPPPVSAPPHSSEMVGDDR